MLKLFGLAVTAVLGIAVGGLSALWMSGLTGGSGFPFSDVEVRGWASDWSIGSAAAGPYTRARVARHGLLALTKSEAVYFMTATDSEGRALSEDCTYAMTGGRQPAAWWSITLYDALSRLPMNTDGALSIDHSQLNDLDTWEAVISATRPEDGRLWLSSRNAGAFDLTLRLYRPDGDLLDAPEAQLNPPEIKRLTCRSNENG
ncbi:MAG: DUF1214 domain-containing protein [Pseudomonadota bacterium]